MHNSNTFKKVFFPFNRNGEREEREGREREREERERGGREREREM
jgi:hypothetical protein